MKDYLGKGWVVERIEPRTFQSLDNCVNKLTTTSAAYLNN